MNYLQSAIFVRKKITSNSGWGDWVNPEQAIRLKDVNSIKVSRSIGGQYNRRDMFSFNVNSPYNSLFENYYSGDGNTKSFTLKYYPVPVEHLTGNWQKLFVYVNGNLLIYSTDFTISGSTLTFTVAPSLGNRNIRIVYPIIETNDLVRIYRWKNSTDYDSLSPTELEQAIAEGLEGPINEPQLSKQDKNIVQVNGQGLIDAIMSGMAFAVTPVYADWDSGTTYHAGDNTSYDNRNYQSLSTNTNKEPPLNPSDWEDLGSTDNRVDLQIQAIIRQINRFNPNRRIYGQDPTEWSILGNPNKKSDGITAFPSIQYSSKYRTAVEMIQELSSAQWTEDGQYIYWINFNSTATTPDAPLGYLGRYEFFWRSKDKTSLNTIYESDFIEKVDLSKTTDDVVNCVIFNAGSDLNGYAVEGLNYDFSFTAYGLSWQYISSTSYIFDQIVTGEVNSNSSKFPVDSNNHPTSKFPTSYPYTFQSFRQRDSYGKDTGMAITVSNANQYNQAYRDEARWKGRDLTSQIILMYSKPRFTVKVQFGRDSNFLPALGGCYRLAFPSFGLDKDSLGNYNLLRIYEVDYNYDNTIVTFKEDEITLQTKQHPELA